MPSTPTPTEKSQPNSASSRSNSRPSPGRPKEFSFSIGPKKKADVEREWVNYHNGTQSLEQTQQNVFAIGRAGAGEVDPDEDDD